MMNTVFFFAVSQCLRLVQITFEEDLRITKMCSGEGEVVPFKEELYPRGNVEDWLLEVERVMQVSLRLILGEARIDYAKVSGSNGDSR